MSVNFFDDFFELFKKDEFKSEIRKFCIPLIELIIQELYPYIYISILLVVISFFLILGIFILLLKNKMKNQMDCVI